MSDNRPNNPVAAPQDTFDINETSYKTSHTAVRKARRFALQGLYEWLMTDRRLQQTGQAWENHGPNSNAPHDIAARTRANNAMHTVHLGYYHELMRAIPAQVDALEAMIVKHLDRSIDQIDRVEHAVLLIGAYELQHSVHIPYKVVLDEAMKLNTHFGATDAHKLINAVMDRLAGELRPFEVAADTQSGYKEEKLSAKTAKIMSDKLTKLQVETLADTLDSNNASNNASNNDNAHSDTPADSDNSHAKPRLSRQRTTAVPSSQDTAESTLKADEAVANDAVIESNNVAIANTAAIMAATIAMSDSDAIDTPNDDIIEAMDKLQNQEASEQNNIEDKDSP